VSGRRNVIIDGRLLETSGAAIVRREPRARVVAEILDLRPEVTRLAGDGQAYTRDPAGNEGHEADCAREEPA